MMSNKIVNSENITRIIKKYPNRRLYDTQLSKYITLKDIHKLVKNETAFQVVDTKTGNDLTRPILLQIILEQEELKNPLFSSDLLRSIIGFYDDPTHGMLSRYLEHSITVFKEHLADLKSPMNSLLGSKTQVNLLHDLAEESIDDWQENRE